MRRWFRACGAGALLALTVLAGCSNAPSRADGNTQAGPGGFDGGSPSGSYPAVSQPGVSSTEIKVAGVASVTNPVGGNYGSAFDGTKAYFDMINSGGGIYGRQLVMTEGLDDTGVKNKEVVQPLLTGDVFAVLPMDTILFTAADDLVAAGIPTFGWTINPEWGGTTQQPKANLFGQEGSYLGIEEPQPTIPYLAKEAGAHKVGILAYGIPQSKQCAAAFKTGVERWGPGVDVEVAFVDDSLAFGDKNLSVQVGQMKDAGVDFVATCVDVNGVVTLATEMDKQGLKATQYLTNGYDHTFVKEFGDLLEGSFVRTSFAPWEIPTDEQPQGLKDFVEWMNKRGAELTENAMTGWINANLFVDGLKAAGPDFTRASLITSINEMTSWNAEGASISIDWTRRHTEIQDPNIFCSSVSKIEDGTFVPAYAQPGKPFLCVDGSDTANPVGEITS